MKLNNITKDLQFSKNENLEAFVKKARKLIKNADNDNFYTMNNELLSFIGSIIMWFSLCQVMSGFNLSIYE